MGLQLTHTWGGGGGETGFGKRKCREKGNSRAVAKRERKKGFELPLGTLPLLCLCQKNASKDKIFSEEEIYYYYYKKICKLSTETVHWKWYQDTKAFYIALKILCPVENSNKNILGPGHYRNGEGVPNLIPHSCACRSPIPFRPTREIQK